MYVRKDSLTSKETSHWDAGGVEVAVEVHVAGGGGGIGGGNLGTTGNTVRCGRGNSTNYQTCTLSIQYIFPST